MNVEDLYRLSPLQEGILFHALRDPGADPYFLQSVFRYERGLDLDRLERTWRKVIARHPILRTAFFWEDIEEPAQVVHRTVDLPFAREDWRHLPESEREKRLRAFLSQDRARGFQLDQAPLMRLTAIRWEGEEHRVVWSYHHLLLDGWSVNLLLQELAALYQSDGSAVLEPQRPFRDYIAWLRRQDLAVSESYWRRRLTGFTEPTTLGIDRAPGRLLAEGARAEVGTDLPEPVTAAVESFARRHRLTFHTVVEGAWALTLSRFSGEQDVVFGSTVSGRPPDLPDSEAMVGCFINTLPMRVRIEPGRELVDWLREVQADQLELRRHEHSPLVEVRRWSDVPGNRPLFDAILVFENFAGQSRDGGPQDYQHTNFPLTLTVWPYRSLALRASFHDGHFEAGAVSRLLAHLEMLLRAFTAERPGDQPLRLCDLPALTPDETEQVTVRWNQTRAEASSESGVHELFAERAKQVPDSPAVELEGESLTYRELNARANLLAHHLRKLGVAPEALVGIAMERSLELPVAVLGVLKAGGAYLPLDPAYPAERLEYMLRDSGARVILSQTRVSAALPTHGARVVPLDPHADWGAFAGDPAVPPENGAGPGHLACVIYTSGSTGRPKGVQVPHRALTNLLGSMLREPGLRSDDKLLAVTSLSFDIAALELFLPLLAGARLEIVTTEEVGDGPRLRGRLAASGATVVQATPSTWRMLLEGGWEEPRLRLSLVGGEALVSDLAASLRRRADEVWNAYGPTETTVYSTARRVEEEVEGTAAIGRPVAETRLYVLDRWGEPAPEGVPGEIYIGGVGVTRGYLGRPDLTAEKFVPDPWSEEPGARLYRTGDLARYLPDGRIDFLGRVDHQVKVRGFRIELGEIEAALCLHPAVAQAAVVANGERLIAYVVPKAGSSADAEELRAFLRGKLPEHMVPAVFVALAALPLTPNRKIDRKALPAPEEATGLSGTEYAAPRTPIEEILANVWAEVLRLERVGIDDDFFSLGGHSLLATRIVSRLVGALGTAPPVRWLFEQPTVRRLAVRIEEARGTGEAASGRMEAPISRLPRGEGVRLPLSFAQERLWFLDRLEPGTPTYNIPLSVEMSGALHVSALASALSEVVRRHESLRTTFEVTDGTPWQRVSPDLRIELPLVDLSDLEEGVCQTEARRLTARISLRSFNLAHGPLLDTVLLRLAPERHRFLLTIHHIVSDGWSVGVLVREMSALYAAFREGGTSPLPELPVQYADFAAWQREALDRRREEELAYWTARLGGEVSPLDLPTDRPRPAVQSYRGGRAVRALSPELSRRIRSFSRREGATLFMTLLAATKVLLQRHSGQDDILVGAPVAGRQRIEAEGLIGIFLNTLVLRTDLAGEPSFRELVARVREVTLGAFSHQDVPFEALLARLQPDRDLSRTPFFQVLFNVLNFPVSEVRLPGLTLEVVSTPEVPSKFDMTFYVAEAGEEIRFDLIYNADLFDAARMEDLLDQLVLALAEAVEHPEEPIGRLSLVTAAARRRLPDPTETLDAAWIGAVHELFAARASQAPERTAAADREGSWSYGELRDASARISGWLLSRGIVKGDRVAIWAHRSAPVVPAVMGTLGAGAAFTMLDPAYPAPRLVEMLRLATPRALVHLEAAGPLPPAVSAWMEETGCPRLDLPQGGCPAVMDRLASLPAETAREPVGPDDVAYVAFTSGSTGTPKGILGRHGPLSHFLPWQCERLGLTADDRFSLLSGLAHDPLQRDIFTPLYLGAAILVPDPQEIGVPGRLAAWMAREGVTVAHLTPAMAQLLTERPAGGARIEAPSLRRVLLVGDALTRLDVARIRALAPRVTCVNLYGSTETQRAVAFHVVDEAEADERGDRARQVLPLGRGMKDVQLLVLNRAGLQAGVGEVGEIAVRSPHLALGYLGDGDLTAAKFTANPFTGEPADRLYRTGDLGRYLPDGEVAFAGRADLQVKIRGFRIEPGEIEATLGGLPGVREAVVGIREERGERRLVAYVVPERQGAVAVAGLREALREHLPIYMVPSAFVLLEKLPLTPNAKVDRRALSRIEIAPSPEAERGHVPPASELERRIAAVWCEVLGLEKVGVQDNFFDLGGHSLLLVRLHSRLQETLGRELSLMDLFSHPNVRAQAEHLARGAALATAAEIAPERRRAESILRRRGAESGAVAVIGMAGRFPGAKDLDRFWENLRDGVESVSFFSEEELIAAGLPPELARNPKYVKARGVLEDEDLFDASFFDYSPRQAELMDPQLRLFLECAWEALESAGYDPLQYPGAIGVHAGVTLSSYFLNNLLSNPDLLREAGPYQLAIGTDRDFLTTQVSYKLNLRGPSINVQTACSTSLVATHLACRALLSGECDMSLAGGVSIKIPQRVGYTYQEGGLDSSDGHCRSFDAKADGSVFGSGIGVVLLKRLEDALADGDTIHAVILGTAVNNDGLYKVGYTAPSIEGQAEVVATAQAVAGVSPETISYVECHGSATALGDPIEVTALTRAFAPVRDPGRCALGSVKTNIGHLGAAAGVAGLIKTILALKNRQIPPSLYFETPNPKIDFDSGPFYVSSRLAEWRANGTPRRAGVSSFGLGGTNAHAVLEEAPEPAPSGPSRPRQLLVLSAKTEAALEAATDNLASWLKRHPDAVLADVAYTLQAGRRAFPYRRMLACSDAGEAQKALAERDPRALLSSWCEPGSRTVAFLLPGVGDHYPGMARGLYEREPLFRAELDRCAELLAGRLGDPLGCDLREILFSEERPREGGLDLRAMLGRQKSEPRRLDRTLFAQPAVFAVDYALARLWMSWGLRPQSLIGYSLGEYVAACLAGVLSLEDALRLVAERARLIEELPAGAMLAVPLPEEEVRPLLDGGLCLAAVNGPQLCVVAGPREEIAVLSERLTDRGLPCRQLPTTHAFHSRMMEPVAGLLTELVRRLRLSPPRIPYLSNVTGTWVTAEQATDPEYWARHLCGTVRFSEGLETLWQDPSRALLEAGPGQGLSALALQHPAAGAGRIALPSLPHAHERQEDQAFLMGTLGRLWLSGIEIDWTGFQAGERRRRVQLPTYPFERRRFWVEPNRSAFRIAEARSSEPSAAVEERAKPAAPAHERPHLRRAYVAPRTDLETQIVSLFERLLGITGVGVHDSFFELGGHSLTGTRLITYLREQLGVELPLETLFDAPTPVALAGAVETALTESTVTPGAPPLVPVTRDGDLPLSFAQQRLWFLEQMQAGSTAYNIPFALRVSGHLDVPALHGTLLELLRRHETLRTAFVMRDRQPVQVIAPEPAFSLPLVDLRMLPAERREQMVRSLATREALRPFDLRVAPLLRALVLRLDEREHAVLLTTHHIASDGWSIDIFLSELTQVYRAFSQGEPSPLPELPIQYADYAHWQREWLQGEALAAQLRYWTEILAGIPVLQLPTDRPRPAIQTYEGSESGFVLSEDLSASLADLARRHDATLFMALVSVFLTLLHRYSGQEDVVIGTPIAGRSRRELEGLIGLFVNTLALRSDLSGDPAFSRLLARIRKVCLGAYAHQDLPFEKLVAELQPERDLSRSPLFQVLLQLLNAPRASEELPDLVVRPVGAEGQSAKLDLILNLQEAAGRVVGIWKFNRILFHRTTINRMSSHFRALLEGVAADPGMRLSELSLLTGAERQQLLERGDSRPAGAIFCLHERFAEQVARAPEAPAVAFESERLSYGELDRRSTRLAQTLRTWGVGPGELVALCLERSLEMVVAILGVLKTGATYVPIDPDYPAERITFVLADSAAPVLLSQRTVAAVPGYGGRTLLLDDDWEALAPEAAEALPAVPPESPAYVIYTSGSTGKPKGVVVSHAHVARLFTSTEAWFGFGPEDVWTLFHSYAFDFSVWEIWGALLYGGRLVVVPYWVSRSPEAFHELLQKERITALNQTPSAFRQILRADEAAPAGALSLRWVVFGGEALELASLAPWFDRHGDEHPRLVNMYGITETTVHVTYRPLGCEDAATAHGSRIGRAIPDLRLRVLDRSLGMAPLGVPGEICIGGAGPALGYLGRPELTAERFVPDPFTAEPGARLYRSGDLARWLPDGDLEYLGRIDHQVKVRGFRIELGEIETALARHPAVREAVVLARADEGLAGGPQLVAYVVAEPETAPSLAELRAFAGSSLPDYMLPTALVVLEQLPLTANGKVDRRALPAPDRTETRDEATVAPSTPLESFLADLFHETLALPAQRSLGIHDDFFALGGNSITGAILINRLQEALSEIVQVVVIFDAPTIAQLAEYLVREHPRAVARLWGEEALGAAVGHQAEPRIDAVQLERFQALVEPLPPLQTPLAGKNPPALFVLSAPRSGSTLMRVMLGGHPSLFAPPELELLSFNTLAERKAAFSGRDSFWLEGLLRALMEVRGCGAEEARSLMEELEGQDLTTAEMYRRLQEWLGGRMLVDKTPSYALDPAILRRAEQVFDQPRYIHLIRHPLGMIRSFEEAKLDQIFFRPEHPFSRRALAELIWLASERNIVGFLQEVPPERQHWVRFEELVREPERVLSGICAFLGLDYHPDMALPYKARSERMTDGLHAESRMLGDVKFHQHRDVDAAVAERWREEFSEDSLGDPTRETAARLGYGIRGQQPQWTRIEPAVSQPDEPVPLSFAQERLWFLDRLAPGSPAYNIPAALRLRGRLDRRAVELSLREIVRRHAVLRTRFMVSAGQPVQVIDPEHGFSISLIDLSGLPERDREVETARLAVRDARLSFDLARGPLFRASLLRLGAEDHAALLAMHHIVSDGWSMGILIREMAALYAALSQGRPSPLPEPEIQYADYARWQRGWLRGEILENEISFWRRALAGAPVLELPTDRPRPPVQTFRGAWRGVYLPPGVSATLTALGHREGASLYMTLLAGFAALLSRDSGQEDVSVGSPTANRTRAQVEGLIGFFVNTLVLRADLSGEPSFRQLLGRVRKTALDAFAHQELPFEKVVEELQPQRDLSRSPLFQVMFTLQNASSERLELPGLTLSPLASGATVAKFDLTLALRQAQDGLGGPLEYNTDLFDAPTIGRMVRHVESLLTAAAADPDRPFSELPLLAQSEHHQILLEWNDTASARPEIGLHLLFESQVELSPEATAIVYRHERRTYREIDEKANRLAHRLRSLGVEPEVRVGVCMERTPDMVISLLAVLKAGGAYVPLDPAYPEERLAFMLADSGAPVVLTQEKLLGRMAPLAPTALALDQEWPDIEARESTAAPMAPVEPRHLAYVIYTSGSTGRPKGVAIEHHSAATLVSWAWEVFTDRETEGVLASTSICFDLSVFELFVPWSRGGKVILAAHALELPILPAAEEVTLINTVPSAIAELARTGKIPTSVRTVNLAGEPLKGSLVREIFERSGAERVLNLYGPSEDTTYSTWAAAERDAGREPTIGRPIRDTRAYVLDRGLRPVAPGVHGELCLAGAGLARGYLGRPELTAERFVPDPFSGAPGGRIYRTGDRVRKLSDGTLEYLGRIDHQVKLRGFRIELGEIEAALSRYPGVGQAVVVVQELAQDDRRLTAYVMPANGAALQPAEMRDYLRSKLPEYMIPSAWAILTALPLTPNGKVDRKALPVPEQTAAKKAAYVAPASSLERLIAGVWQDVLGADTVGIHDNFFDLGGHSLLMAKVQGQLSDLLGREIGLVDLFSYPTIGSLARFLSPKESEEALQARAEVEEVEQIEIGMTRAKQLRRSRREVDI